MSFAVSSPAALSLPHPLPPLGRARVVGAYAKTAVDTARELGADLARLGQACGLADLQQALPENVPVERYIALLDAAATQLNEPFFGLQVGRRMRLSTFASYGLVLCTCPTLRSAAEQTRRFESLAHDLGRSEIVEADGVAHYRWHSPWLDRPGGRHLSESVMVGIQTFVHWLAGTELPVLGLSFVHAPPEGVPLEVYSQGLGAPVRFNATVTEASFPAALLDAPLANADTSLFAQLAQTAEQRLAARQREASEAPIAQAVRERIQAQLMHDRARLPEVAEALALSPRSLQRKLAEAGLSFSALLDETRRELACAYLRDASLSLTEIAFLLGFGEQSNFNHAFRAWFNTTPAAWRERQGR
ncbi:AraC family transcriptional regulator [Paucibacter sp. APW11]|uniref:AraC family transcriptional regulator n=1 Tax=Roseateles aquae TaxID=3077235 RepID=A0ABU3PG28_9BURK|nr:AraC family transcriptional regulator [Paucibacter sp. APW11]MDT9001481.1 AraC family transcriptional regulator [Paucibacter sp. APW11]